MSQSQSTWDEPFVSALACGALDPSLRSVLVFDASADAIRKIGAGWAQMLEQVTGRSVVPFTLGPTIQDDDLWGSLAFPQSAQDRVLSWRSGPLVQVPDDTPLHLILIPTLTQLSLAAARAFVTLAGAPVVHMERHGQHSQWQPRICWLAGCATEEVGKVSPHLLDRFTLRLKAPSSDTSDRVQGLLDRLGRGATQVHKALPIPPTLLKALSDASDSWADVTDEAIEQVLQFFSDAPVTSARRPLSLMRLAVAHARLQGDGKVLAWNVQEAVQLMGLVKLAEDKRPPSSSAIDAGDLGTQPAALRSEEGEVGEVVEQRSEISDGSEVSVYHTGPPESFASTPLTSGFTPYPEDAAAIEHEATSLLLPFSSYRAQARGQGSVIGVERARVPHDLALVHTLVEAAKFQVVRKVKQQQVTHDGLILSPSDLRRYRRAPVPERMLVLLIDYTSLRECEWIQTLIPYLRWAYVERASVCLISVGANDAFNELMAERLLASTILTPQLDRALEMQAGRATPLAHGLELAQQTLRHALQHGRSTIDEALLVVLSDGRGNVPLESSHSGRLSLPVGRHGVEDALHVAQLIREMPRVRAVLLDPQPEQYTYLPHDLARALGATISSVPRHAATERGGEADA